MDGWTDGRMDGQTDARSLAHTHARMHARTHARAHGALARARTHARTDGALARARLFFGAREARRAVQEVGGGTIRLETLIELKFLNSSFSSSDL